MIAMRWRHRFRVTREHVARREAVLLALEDAAIRAARDSAATDEERALVDELIEERERNRRARESQG
jgi:hypothetical protein